MIRMTKFGALLAALSMASACSSSTNSTTSGSVGSTGNGSSTSSTGSGSSGTGSGSGSGSSSSGSTANLSCDAGYFCNGLEFRDSSMVDVFLGDYPEADNLVFNCKTSWDGLKDAGLPTTVSQISGVMDLDTSVQIAEGANGTLFALFPESCFDIGVDAGPALPTMGSLPSMPSGAISVNTALTTSSGVTGATLFGIVTYVKSPYWDTDVTPAKGESGTLYIQDPPPSSGTPVPLSGVNIYIPGSAEDGIVVSDAGAIGYPYADGGLTLGDVVTITNVSTDNYEAQRELEYSKTSVITVLGQTTLPPPIPLTATQLSAGSATATSYAGMRVIQTSTDTLISNCPLAMQSCITE
jgi:hypothetical protein